MMKNFFISLVILFLAGIPAHGQNAFQVSVSGETNEQSILFFPGFASTSAIWEETVKELSRDYKCHVFTFAGFGNLPPIPSPWLETIKNEIIAYVKENKIRNPILVGHSLGGSLSYWLAIEEPGLFKQIIAVDALPCTAAIMIPEYKGEPFEYDNPHARQLLEMDDETFDHTIRQQVSFMSFDTSRHDQLVAMMKATDRETYVYGYIDLLNLDLRNNMSEIKIPVTVLATSFPDKETVQKTYDAQLEKLPLYDIKYAHDAGHFIMIDQPQWFIKNLKESLQ